MERSERVTGNEGDLLRIPVELHTMQITGAQLAVAAGVGAAVAAYLFYQSSCSKPACSKPACSKQACSKPACSKPAKSSGACKKAAGPFTTLENAQGEKVNAGEALKGKVVALYYSAHWCSPCRKFTPILHALYEELNEDSNQFEVRLVVQMRMAPVTRAVK